MMDRWIGRVRKPVRRDRAVRYLLFTLLSFAASVSLTRLLLGLTGYPQLGNDELHIAHVLWGGLLLFIAALLPLIFTNRWAFALCSLLAGTGVGLFIDEVGKFITRSNNYFHPAAAPIIYAFFLLTVVVFLQVRRPHSREARAELYRALESLKEVLDHDLEPAERIELEIKLRDVRSLAEHPQFARLADALLQFLDSDQIQLAPERPDFIERTLGRLKSLETRWITRRRLKAGLVGGLLALGGFALVDFVSLLMAVRAPQRLEATVAEWVSLGQVADSSGLFWFLARVSLEGMVGVLGVLAAFFLFSGMERRGVDVGVVGLLLALSAVNLLVFYFEQFSTIVKATLQFTLLMTLFYYRRRFLTLPLEPPGAADGS
jgi:hypothetical protein